MTLRRSLAIACTLALAVSLDAVAQDGSAPAAPAAPAKKAKAPKPEPTLKVGMPAPAFKVEKFIKGEGFDTLQKGQVYVVEFWATWCGPCIQSMPHISELQAQYRDKGVTICGVNIWQDDDYNDETWATVEKFMKDKGETMAYTVAYDGGAKQMATNWMTAAGRNGIPTSFVVDKSGTVAWIGHPMMLDLVLDEVTRGIWDPSKGDARIKEAYEAFESAAAKYAEGAAAGDAAWLAASKEFPSLVHSQEASRVAAMFRAKLTKEGDELGAKILEGAAQHGDAARVQGLLQTLSNPEILATPGAKALFLKAAIANKELAKQESVDTYARLAQAYFASGQIEEGQAAGAKAMALAPAQQRPALEKFLKRMEAQAAKPSDASKAADSKKAE